MPIITKEMIKKRLLQESTLHKDEKSYEIICYDNEGSLMKILEAVKSLGDRGHSCNIIIDPGSQNELQIYYDGDGSDRIKEIKVKE